MGVLELSQQPLSYTELHSGEQKQCAVQLKATWQVVSAMLYGAHLGKNLSIALNNHIFRFHPDGGFRWWVWFCFSSTTNYLK